LQPARERVAARIGSIKKRPFGEYAFDVIVLNTPDEDDNRYILVVIDSFSKAVELFPIKKASADTVTTCLHDVLCRWGRPYQVRCDNAKAFAASVTTQLLKRAKVRQHFTAPYSHNSNGQVENANRRVMEILRAMILDERLGPQTHLRWSLLLPAVRRVMMSRTILQYGCCPNDIAYMISPENEDSIFAEELWTPGAQELAAGEVDASIATLARQHQALIDKCEEIQDAHLTKLAVLQEMEAPDASPILPGEFVLVDMRERPHTKINSPWSGPWQVIEQQDNDPTHPMMLLQHIASKKIDKFNASMCKRCNLDLLSSVDEAIPAAAADNFEYVIEAILDHRPRGERKRKSKSAYEFLVLWQGLERNEDNPSWEPYDNESLRASEPMEKYCARSEVMAELGKDFLPAAPKEAGGAAKKRRDGSI
jgi:transposase InsO family protein